RGLPVRGVIVAKRENLAGLAVPENVEVRSGISTEDLRALYAASSCVAVPMVPDGDPRGSESSGNTALLEAMACGRATVVSRRASLSEYLYDDASRTVPGGDTRGLRAALASVTGDPALAHELGAAARKHVEERHTSA